MTVFDRRWTEVDVLRALAATDAVRCGPELINVLYESVLCADGERRPAALMELGVLGRSLRAWLSERSAAGLDADDRLRVIVLVLECVQRLHAARFIHGDIKPTNVLVVGNGATMQVRLIDFEMAVLLGADEPSTDARTGWGTKYYVAPEVADRERYSQSADAWSLGVTLLSSLCGGAMPQDDVYFSMLLSSSSLREAREKAAEFRGLDDDEREYLVRSACDRCASSWSSSSLPAVARELARMVEPEPADRASVADVLAAVRKLVPTAAASSTCFESDAAASTNMVL